MSEQNVTSSDFSDLNSSNGDSGSEEGSGDIYVSDPLVSPHTRWIQDIKAKRAAKEANFLRAGFDDTTNIPAARPRYASRVTSFLSSLKAFKLQTSRPDMRYRDSFEWPAPEHPGPPVTVSLPFPRDGPLKLRKIFGEGGKWEVTLP
ncbi:hypothetical protein HWV62_38054 [Athelia sp. TMB]|nr:hypothetical protein HWV62_38054 [Athelia sp. TMB]